MTTISPDALLRLLQTQIAMPKLAIGAKLIADVVGPTRHGLAISLESEPFLLKAKGDLPDARNLTLKVTERASSTGHKVQILAADNQSLTKPVRGTLTSRLPVPVAQSASATIAEDHQIEVNARPVTSDGKVLGPPLIVRLATRPAAGPPATSQPANHAVSLNSPGVAAAERPVAEQHSGRQAATPLPQLGTFERAAPPPPPTLLHGARAVSTPAQQPSTSPIGKALPENPLSKSAVPAPMTIPNRDRHGMIAASVVGRAPDSGQALLQIADDLLMKVEQPIDLPIGTTLNMTLLTGSINNLLPSDLGPSMNQSGLLVELIELLEGIERVGEKASEHREPASTLKLPMPDRHLAAKLLQLFGLQAAPQLEDTGNTVHDRHGVEPSKTHQLQRLLSDMGNAASEPLADGWRSTSLPLGPDPAQAVMIHHKEHSFDSDSDGNSPDADEAVAQRAIFDIDFSRLGRCQIDTLCQENRFDLLLRSEKPLGHGLRQEITDLFSSACDIAGLNGEIGYRQGQFVEPAKMPKSTRTVTT